MQQRICSQCGAPVDPNAQSCKYCGEVLAPVMNQPAPQAAQPPQAAPRQQAVQPPRYVQPQQPVYPPQYAQPQQPVYPPQYAQPQQPVYPAQYAQPQQPVYPAQYAQPQQAQRKAKSKTTAGILAIFLGGIGVHKFYLNRPWLGILYLLLCWTYVPAVVGLIEGIIYLASSDQKFYEKYVRK